MIFIYIAFGIMTAVIYEELDEDVPWWEYIFIAAFWPVTLGTLLGGIIKDFDKRLDQKEEEEEEEEEVIDDPKSETSHQKAT